MNKLITLVAFLFLATSISLAQEELKPEKHKDVSWHNVVKIDFKPGKAARAKEIIKVFEAAGTEAGTPGPERFWFVSGEYDLMLIWTMKDGPSVMEWRRTENSIKWRKAMIKKLGSEEKYEELREEYSSLISSSTNEICRKELK